MALANGDSTINVGELSKMSKHAITQIEVLKLFMPDV
jgi:hypothetical protein